MTTETMKHSTVALHSIAAAIARVNELSGNAPLIEITEHPDADGNLIVSVSNEIFGPYLTFRVIVQPTVETHAYFRDTQSATFCTVWNCANKANAAHFSTALEASYCSNACRELAEAIERSIA